MKTVGIIGSGFIGKALAEYLNARKYQVKLSFRSNRPELSTSSISVHHCDVKEQDGKVYLDADTSLFMVDVLVICIPPGFKKGLGDSYTAKTLSLLNEAQKQGVKQVVFTSSIGIYTQTGKVSELSTLTLDTPKAKALFNAEQAILNSGLKNKHVLRLAGLIGANRHPGRFRVALTDENANEPVNMVMQNDVVMAIAQVIEAPEEASAIYNIVSPHHPAKQAFYRYARQRLNDERVNEPLIVSDKGRSAESSLVGKVVEGDLICQELGFTYEYDNLYSIFDSVE